IASRILRLPLHELGSPLSFVIDYVRSRLEQAGDKGFVGRSCMPDLRLLQGIEEWTKALHQALSVPAWDPVAPEVLHAYPEILENLLEDDDGKRRYLPFEARLLLLSALQFNFKHVSAATPLGAHQERLLTPEFSMELASRLNDEVAVRKAMMIAVENLTNPVLKKDELAQDRAETALRILSLATLRNNEELARERRRTMEKLACVEGIHYHTQ